MRNSRKPRRKETEVLAIKHPLQTSQKVQESQRHLMGIEDLYFEIYALTTILRRQAAKAMPNAQDPSFPNRNKKKSTSFYRNPFSHGEGDHRSGGYHARWGYSE